MQSASVGRLIFSAVVSAPLKKFVDVEAEENAFSSPPWAAPMRIESSTSSRVRRSVLCASAGYRRCVSPAATASHPTTCKNKHEPSASMFTLFTRQGQGDQSYLQRFCPAETLIAVDDRMIVLDLTAATASCSRTCSS
mgnify:CR=1 FL=1